MTATLVGFMCLVLIGAVLFWATLISDSRMMPKLFRVLSILVFIAFVFGWGSGFLSIILRNLGYAGSDLEHVLNYVVPAVFVGIFGSFGLVYYKHRFLTVTQFKKIKLGMNYDEVVSLIGNPTNSASADGITTYVWRFSGSKGPATYRTVFFQDDRVISKLKGAYRETGLLRIILVLIFLPIVLLIIGAIIGGFGDIVFAIAMVSPIVAIVLLGVVFVRSISISKRLSAGLSKVTPGMSYDEIISLLDRPHDSAIYDDIVTCVWNIGGIRGVGRVVRAIVFKDDKAISILQPD